MNHPIQLHESNLEVVRKRYDLINSLEDTGSESHDITKANQFFVIVQIGQDPQLDTNSKTQYIRSVIWYLQGGKDELETFHNQTDSVGLAKGETIKDFFGCDIKRAANDDGIIIIRNGSHAGQFFGTNLPQAKAYAFLYWLSDQPELRANLINRLYQTHTTDDRVGGYVHDRKTLFSLICKAGFLHCLPEAYQSEKQLPTTDGYNFLFDLKAILKIWEPQIEKS